MFNIMYLSPCLQEQKPQQIGRLRNVFEAFFSQSSRSSIKGYHIHVINYTLYMLYYVYV